MELETALVIVAPPEVQEFSAPFRERYTATRIPAHLTLLYPFVPVDEVDVAAERLRGVCSEVAPFEITLDRYGEFETAIFLEPSDPRLIRALFRLVANAFPEHPPYGGEFGPDLHPHLTLAAFERPDQKGSVSLRSAPSFTFWIDRLHIFVGTSDPPGVPWVSRAISSLSGRL